MTIPCIILAGGLGTRLQSAVPDRPKCLAPVGDRSFLEIQLELLVQQGVTDFVLSLGYLAKQVVEEVNRLRDRFDVRTVIEPQPLGTGGAMAFTMRYLGLDEVLVTNGDTFLGGNLSAMLQPLDLNRQELARMAVIHVPDRRRFGGVQALGDRVVSFSEKGASGPGWINAGLYRLHAMVFDSPQPCSAFSFETQILPGLAANGKLGASQIDGVFTDIGIPDEYYRFCSEHKEMPT
jgi:D-glycero-alpha-D-manno-heptose 1-phosphate guanylyltransferase